MYCVLELLENKPVRTSVNKDKKDPVWSEAFVLYVQFHFHEVLIRAQGICFHLIHQSCW